MDANVVPAPVPTTLLDVEAAAAILGTSTRHVRELIYRRDIPYIKVGRLVRFTPEAIAGYLDARTVPAAPTAGGTAPAARRAYSAQVAP